MKLSIQNILLTLFIIACGVNLYAEFIESTQLIFISKPSLMILLSAWFYYSAKEKNQYFNLIAAALFFSLLGDSLLMIVEANPAKELFFIFGLGSFLLAHVAYLVGFRLIGNYKRGLFGAAHYWKWPLFGLFFLMIWVLKPGIPDDLQLPVAIYCFVIILMVMSCIHLKAYMPYKIFKWLMLGATLFLISDTIIGLNKFRTDLLSIPYVRLWIMSFYLLGQYFIVKGSIKYLNQKA